MRIDSNELVKHFRDFLGSFQHEYIFPVGEGLGILADCEVKLALLLKGLDPAEVIECLRIPWGRDAFYSFVAFSVRSAIYAVRVGDGSYISRSLFLIVVDDGEIDWRDILISLSIIEDCSNRIGFEFSEEISKLLPLSYPRRAMTILDGYMARSAEMRSVGALGYKAINIGSDNLSYIRDY